MSDSFFFYDLETTGISPHASRVMQFAGQRTTLDLEPMGEPVNIFIKLTPDIVPDPDAILITGITPQQTLQDGITEAEFLREFSETVAIPGTIFVGYNTIRFDDEFMRFMQYRNFYDPYEWQWKDGRSRWDLLDVVRMTRALRPEGIEWPFDSKGKPSNRLELLTTVNKLDHYSAHDALSDVHASIALARLLRDKQPKLFQYLLSIRGKKEVEQLVAGDKPFVYTSGRYPSEFEKTTVACFIAKHPKKQGAFVYDLRHDPEQYKDMNPEELVSLWKWSKDATEQRLPVKTLQYNHCPAVAPLSVLDPDSQARLKVDMERIEQHKATLASMPEFPGALLRAFKIMDSQQQTEFLSSPRTVDGQLYDGFIDDYDKKIERDIVRADPTELGAYRELLHDPRLQEILPLYKARNFPAQLSGEERASWDAYCTSVLLDGGEKSRLARYFARLGELAESEKLTDQQQYLLEELQLYGQSLLPAEDQSYLGS